MKVWCFIHVLGLISETSDTLLITLHSTEPGYRLLKQGNTKLYARHKIIYFTESLSTTHFTLKFELCFRNAMFVLNLKWADVFYWILKQLGLRAWNGLKYFGVSSNGKFLKNFRLPSWYLHKSICPSVPAQVSIRETPKR